MTDYSNMEKESKKVASEQQQYIAIVSDRYKQEMKKAAGNIKYEVENAKSPYLGLTNSELARLMDVPHYFVVLLLRGKAPINEVKLQS